MNTVCGLEGGCDVDNSVTRDKGGGTKLFGERTDFPANLIHRKIYILSLKRFDNFEVYIKILIIEILY